MLLQARSPGSGRGRAGRVRPGGSRVWPMREPRHAHPSNHHAHRGRPGLRERGEGRAIFKAFLLVMYVCIDPARAACVNPPAFPLQMAVFDCVWARTRRKIHEITSPKPSYLPLCSSAAVSIPRCYNVDEAPCSRWDQVHRGRGSKTPPRAVLASQAQYRARVGMDDVGAVGRLVAGTSLRLEHYDPCSQPRVGRVL